MNSLFVIAASEPLVASSLFIAASEPQSCNRARRLRVKPAMTLKEKAA